MAKAIVDAGVCGFITEIEATSDDMTTVILRITSECPAYSYLKDDEFEFDAFECCFSKLGENPVYELFRKTSIHAACVVPAAAIKAMEVACDLALPRDTTIKISR